MKKWEVQDSVKNAFLNPAAAFALGAFCGLAIGMLCMPFSKGIVIGSYNGSNNKGIPRRRGLYYRCRSIRIIRKEEFVMNKALRKAIIAGNWKMNKNRKEAAELINALKPIAADKTCGVIICVPFTNLETALSLTEGTNIEVGAENVHFEKSGAFTGEISADMLTEMGVKYVIVGHSERRQYFGETDETVNKRTTAAIEAGMTVILCVGETLAERELGITEEVVAKQVKVALHGLTADQVKNIVIAYEPVWAIGTGKTATAEQAEEVCAFIRATVASLYDQAIANGMTIQYGGSMNEKNCAELLAKENIDGGLIGGASLVAEKFGVLLAEASK